MRERPLSFASSGEMRKRIDLLPGTVPWKQVEVKVPGGSTTDPLVLNYRPADECFEELFKVPLFREHMDYTPRREYTDGSKKERLYNEIFTGDRAWELQVRMPCMIAY